MAARHYIPQWVLRQFLTGEKIFELNILTARIDDRGLRKKAGAVQNFWSQDVEDDVMTPWDTVAATLYRNEITGKRIIKMQEPQRLAFATWIALFMARVPTAHSRADALVDEWKTNPEIPIQVLMEGRTRVIEILKNKSSEIYNLAMKEMGPELGAEWLMSVVVEAYRQGIIKPNFATQDVWEHHLRNLEPTKFAEIICRYQWTWYYSNGKFIIGDNPFIRWSRITNMWDIGIIKSEIEITLPLSSSICLCIRPEKASSGNRVLKAPSRLVKQFNRRQRCAAFNYVYSGERKYLESWKVLWLTPEEAKRMNEK